MIHSMTGFGAAEGAWGRGRLLVEVRSVNHRFFNPTIKLPARLQRWEAEVREALRSRVARGHVSLGARIEVVAAGGLAIDEVRVAAYAGQLRGLADRLGLAGGVDIATILRLWPFKAGRVIDLSYAAAGALNMHGQGLARVKVEVIDEPRAASR